MIGQRKSQPAVRIGGRPAFLAPATVPLARAGEDLTYSCSIGLCSVCSRPDTCMCEHHRGVVPAQGVPVPSWWLQPVTVVTTAGGGVE